jgi:hypothetical protein
LFDVAFLDDPRTSSGSRPYLFSSGVEAFNFVSFNTPPFAVPIAGWATALVSLASAWPRPGRFGGAERARSGLEKGCAGLAGRQVSTALDRARRGAATPLLPDHGTVEHYHCLLMN